MRKTVDTNEHVAKGEAKLNTLIIDHESFKIKQQKDRLKHSDLTRNREVAMRDETWT